MKKLLVPLICLIAPILGIDQDRVDRNLAIVWSLYEQNKIEKAILLCSVQIDDPEIDDVERVHYLVARSIFFLPSDHEAYRRDFNRLQELSQKDEKCWQAWRSYD